MRLFTSQPRIKYAGQAGRDGLAMTNNQMQIAPCHIILPEGDSHVPDDIGTRNDACAWIPVSAGMGSDEIVRFIFALTLTNVR